MRLTVIRSLAILVLVLPPVLALSSPLLAWRDDVYITASFAGIIGLSVLALQPLLATSAVPGLTGRKGRVVHRWTGAALLGLVAVHVGGLWLTSPPDVVDVVLFRAPAPFSIWGMLALIGLLATSVLAWQRRRVPYGIWQGLHVLLGLAVVLTTALHALLIEGLMESLSKAALSGMAVFTAALALRQIWYQRRKRAGRQG